MVKEEIKYKETGIEWVPTIPSHWEMRRIKTLFTFRKEIVGEDSSQYKVLSLTVQGDGIIERDIESGMGKFPATFDGYQKIEPNSIVLCLFDMDVTPRIVGFSELTGMISAAYTNIVPKESVYPKFYYYYFLNQDRDKSLYALGKGIRITLREDSFGSLYAPYPSYEEQKVIAEHLDAQIEKINLFIQKKQRFIELLKEQRQSKIDEAITKGINPNVKFKNTRYDWLGSIPEHWEIRRLGTIGSFSKGGNISRAELVENGIPAILYGDIYTKYDIEAKSIINRIEEETAAKSIKIEKGDLLFTGSGETKEDIGKCIIFNGEDDVYVGGDVIIFKQNEFDSHFISYSQNSSVAKYQKAVSSKGDIIVHTYGSKLRDVVMPYPPTIEEQKQIVSHIKTETATIDTAIAKAEREIELIREYKEAMIAEAVMGKRK